MFMNDSESSCLNCLRVKISYVAKSVRNIRYFILFLFGTEIYDGRIKKKLDVNEATFEQIYIQESE